MRLPNIKSALWPMLIVVVLALFWLPSCSQESRASHQTPLRVAIDLWPGYYPLIIADEKGYFSAENVRVEISLPQNTDHMMADFAARSYDIVAVALGDAVNAAIVNSDIRVFMVADQSNGGDAIVSTQKTLGADDIRGQKIGTNLGGFGEVFVTHWLKEKGLRLSDVTLVNVDSAEVPSILAQRELLLAHTWEPYVSRAVALGHHILFTSKETPGLIPDVLATHASVIESRKEKLVGFTNAWFRALEWWQQNPEAGNALVEKRLKLKPGSVSTSGIRLMDRQANQKTFVVGNSLKSLYHVTQVYIDDYHSKGNLVKHLSPQELLSKELIK